VSILSVINPEGRITSQRSPGRAPPRQHRLQYIVVLQTCDYIPYYIHPCVWVYTV